MPKKKIFLLDGSYLAYRSYFAFSGRPLFTTKGENTSAVFAFTNSLVKVLDDEKPDAISVAFDTPEPTFRHKAYAEYKATRDKTPDDLVDQLPRIREVVEGFNIPIIEVHGYEADDVIATMARRAAKEGYHAFLLTADKDLLQLVGPGISIYRPGRRADDAEIADAKWVKRRWEVDPTQIRDVLSLMGDSSDNIPGVPGIGQKTAVKLIHQFGSVENLFANLDKVDSQRYRDVLQENSESARLAYQLVSLDENVPLDVDLAGLLVQEPDTPKLAALFRELEFRALSERYQKSHAKLQQDYRAISAPREFEKFVEQLSKQKSFVFDLETTEADPMRAELVGFSFSWKEGTAYYIPVSETQIQTPSAEHALELDLGDPAKKSIGPPLAQVLPILKKILEDPAREKCGQNIKYDMLVLSRYGVEVQGVSFDTMVASYLLDPGNRQHNIDSLALEYLDYKKVPTSELIGKGKKQITMREVPLEDITFYACEDADITRRLQHIFEPKLKASELYELFQKVEISLIPVLKQMEWNGVALNVDLLRDLSMRMENDLIELEKKIYHEAGQDFNINSPSQLGTVLFEKMNLPKARKTKTGYSTDVAVLEELAKIHAMPKMVLDYRQLAKLKSTYADALPRIINPYTGRVHTSYNQTVAATGRLSSTDPNLQNIPIRTELGREIRRAFIPGKPDHLILDVDYSQIELRVMAHLSGDQRLLETFAENLDIHAATAAKIFDIPLDEVTQDHRRKAKEINFGIMYGMGRYGLSNRLDISFEEADEFIESYFQQFPDVKAFIDHTIEEARTNGYVTTMMNRRRYLPEIQSGNRRMREFAERTAVNTPIQGTAADMIKVAMLRIHDELQKGKYRSMMIMQVHDELVFEAPKSELDKVSKIVIDCMESALELKVPVRADVGTGQNWLEAH
jgi:DNA polymerase-1